MRAARKGKPNVANLQDASADLELSVTVSANDQVHAAALATQATARATIAMARDVEASHRVLMKMSDTLEEQLERSRRMVANYEELNRYLATRLDCIVVSSEATRSQLQRLANNITSRS